MLWFPEIVKNRNSKIGFWGNPKCFSLLMAPIIKFTDGKVEMQKRPGVSVKIFGFSNKTDFL